ncbi:MAG: LamG-like jellyroll fold domain-containing protein, partial [Verrucomicrobiaceae bacterium]
MKTSTSFLHAAWQILLAFTLLALAENRCNAQTVSITIQTAVTDDDNSTILDDLGNTPEYVVIKNNTGATIELAGWSLSDDPGIPGKWPFPTNANIGAGATKLIFASGANLTGKEPYATNFRLPCGATVCLYQQSALRDQRTVTGTNCAPCTKVITKGSPLSYDVPTAAYSTLGTAWTTPNYQDGQWSRGGNCVGYDSDPICDNLILYSSFDRNDIDTTNHLIFDMSGPTLHTGSYVTGSVNIPVTGKVKDAVQFSGSVNNNSLVTYADDDELDLGASNYTFAIWLNPQRTGSLTEVIYQKYDPGTATGYYLTKDGTSGATFTVTAPGGSFEVRTTSALTLNTWVHLAVVMDRFSGQFLLYRNGVVVDKKFLPSSLFISNSKPLLLAKAFGSYSSFQGFEDEFTIWGRPLSNTEISTIYSRSSQGYSFKTTVINVTGATIAAGSTQVTIPAGVTGLTAGMALTGNSFQTGTTIVQVNGLILSISPVPVANGSSFVASGASTGNEPYQPCITTDVETQMKGVNSSIYIRIPFTMPNPSLVTSLQLSIKYDDGFIAYLNGTKVAERNAPTPPNWNSAASFDRPDLDALTPEVIDLSSFKNLLLSGAGNILAIHGLNADKADARFLICPELCYEQGQPNDCYRTTNGREFWLAFPANTPDDASNPLQLNICITGTNGTTGVVESPFYSISIPFSIGVSGSVNIPVSVVLNLEKSDTIENKGLHILASQDVAVYGRTREDYTTDTFLGIPLSCLGSEYLVLGYKNTWMGFPDLNGSQFGIVATADATRVTVTPKKTTGSHLAGVPYSFNLNKGQTYLLRNTDADTTPDRDDISGT